MSCLPRCNEVRLAAPALKETSLLVRLERRKETRKLSKLHHGRVRLYSPFVFPYLFIGNVCYRVERSVSASADFIEMRGVGFLGPQFRVSKQRGEWFELPSGVSVLATIHPSAVLRAQERRDEEFAGLVRDLKRIAERL